MDKVFDELKARLRREEGIKQYPYVDTAGKLTIGVGHNLTDRGLSKTIVEEILDEDVDIAVSDAKHMFDEFWSWPENRRIAIADLMFALGRPTFLTFTKMIQAIHDADWTRVAVELYDSHLKHQWGQRLVDLCELIRTDGGEG